MTIPSITQHNYNTESERAPQQINDLPGGALVLPGQRPGKPTPEKCVISEEICTVKNPENPYLEYIGKRVTSPDPLKRVCPGFFIFGQCENEHQFAAELYCEKEWCKVCGEINSDHHKRKVSKWLSKAQSWSSMGYITLTIPEKLRDQYRTKAAWSLLSKKMVNGDKSKRIEGLIKKLGYDSAFWRWHWFSEAQPGKYHPHLNVLIPAGRITRQELNLIKKRWAEVLGVEMAVVHYQYTSKPKKMFHFLKYVTRATFKERYWDNELADELFGFRNMRCFGGWSGELVWELDEAKQGKENYCRKLSEGICPICGTKVTWRGVFDILKLQIWEAAGWAEPVGEGYYRLGGGESGENGGHS